MGPNSVQAAGSLPRTRLVAASDERRNLGAFHCELVRCCLREILKDAEPETHELYGPTKPYTKSSLPAGRRSIESNRTDPKPNPHTTQAPSCPPPSPGGSRALLPKSRLPTRPRHHPSLVILHHVIRAVWTTLPAPRRPSSHSNPTAPAGLACPGQEAAAAASSLALACTARGARRRPCPHRAGPRRPTQRTCSATGGDADVV